MTENICKNSKQPDARAYQRQMVPHMKPHTCAPYFCGLLHWMSDRGEKDGRTSTGKGRPKIRKMSTILENLTVQIENELLVLTGVQWFAVSLRWLLIQFMPEGQRRYMESLSSYARQFAWDEWKKPDESIEGLPPAISTRNRQQNPRSPWELLQRNLIISDRCMHVSVFRTARNAAKDQEADCRSDGRPYYGTAGADEIAASAPVVRGRKGTHAKLLEQAKRSGYVRVQIDGNLYELSEEIKLTKISSIISRLL